MREEDEAQLLAWMMHFLKGWEGRIRVEHGGAACPARTRTRNGVREDEVDGWDPRAERGGKVGGGLRAREKRRESRYGWAGKKRNGLDEKEIEPKG